MAYAQNQQFEEAQAAFTVYEKLYPNEGRPHRNWTMYHTLQGNANQALQSLQKAIELGYDDIEWLQTDSSMDSLRGLPLFKELLDKLEQGE